MSRNPATRVAISIDRLRLKCRDRGYRHGYVSAHTRQVLAAQLRRMRGKRTQEDFAKQLGIKQTVLSRLEDPNYGKMTLQTLLDIAAKLDVALIVRFATFTDFIKTSRKNLNNATFNPKPYRSRG